MQVESVVGDRPCWSQGILRRSQGPAVNEEVCKIRQIGPSIGGVPLIRLALLFEGSILCQFFFFRQYVQS